MVKILLSLYFALAPLMSFAAVGLPVPGKIEDATIFPGLLSASNYVANPIAYPNKSGTNPPLNASHDRSASSGDQIFNKSSWTCDTSAQGGYCSNKLMPLGDEMKGGYCKIYAVVKGDASLYSVQVMVGSTVKYTERLLSNTTDFTDFKSAMFPCSKDYDGIRITQTESGTAPKINYGLGFGKADGYSQVAQAYFVGGMEQVGINGGTCVYAENTSTGLNDYKDLGTGSGCNAWVVDQGSNGISPVGTNDHRIQIASMPAGRYEITVSGLFQSTQQLCQWQLSDGTAAYQPQGTQWQYAAAGSGDGGTPSFKYFVPISSAKASTTTYKLQAADSGSGACALNNAYAGGNVSWKITYFPTSSQLALNPNLPTQPTITKFLSGSGTYTTPAGVTSIKVRMVGGGGGGAGSGTAAIGSGTIGGNTTFGTSLLVASGGAGGGAGSASPAPGGAASISSPASGTALSGGYGGSNFYTRSAQDAGGGNGGNSAFGGGGGGGAVQASPGGSVGAANTGGGGGGGGIINVSSAYTGGGGGAGGFVDAIINNPAPTYSYVVANGGPGGPAGTSGNAGGDGAKGYIEITEYYQGMNVPVLFGGVTTSGDAKTKVVYAAFGGSASGGWPTTVCSSSPCVIASQSGSWLTQVSRTGTGTYQFTIAAGEFSGPVVCTAITGIAGVIGGGPVDQAVVTNTATSAGIRTFNTAGTIIDQGASVTCLGPR